VAYNGAGFHGLQLQPSKNSIQAEIEKTLAKLFKKKIRIRFLSRTDTGVHAQDQWIIIENGAEILFQMPKRQARAVIPSLNALLHPHISVWQIGLLREDFHFKMSVRSKEYAYQIFNSPVWDPTLAPHFWWRRRPLQIERLEKSLKSLVGRHDFCAFTKSSGENPKNKTRGTFREIFKAQIKAKKHPRISDACFVEVRLAADGFLQHMVRNIVGSLVEYDEGKVASLAEILKSKRREKAGRSAPPEGLILQKTEITRSFYRPLAPQEF